jgi:hypothetical protein
MQKQDILARITEHYLTSADFNGSSVEDLGENPEEARRIVRELVSEGKVVLNFADRHPNPHILAFEPEPKEEQIGKLDRLVFEEPRYEQFGPIKTRTNCNPFGAYPSKSHLRDLVVAAFLCSANRMGERASHVVSVS